MSRRAVLPFVALALVFAAAQPGGATPHAAVRRTPRTEQAPRLLRLEITPREVRLDRPGALRRMLLTGHYADGSTRDLTDRARWISLRRDVVAVQPGGVLLPRADGTASVAAHLGSLRIGASVLVRNAAAPSRWTYANHVAPLLTKLGCNGGSCHGAPAGRGGFKLSLFNADPAADYRTLARDGHARRIIPADPTASLLLKKPALQVPHKGGQRLTAASPEYALLATWIAAGAPEGSPHEATPVSLEVLPRGRVLAKSGETQRLVALARFSDGTTQDVTAQATFVSNDEAVATVDGTGRVTAAGSGEAPILVRWAGLVTAATVGAVSYPAVPDFPVVPESNPVDRFVFSKLRALHIPPAPPASDAEFLRRAALDLTATLPTPEEARAFLSDTRPDRRARWVETLLQKPEYADHQALLWAERLRSNSRFHRIGGVRSYQKWLKESFLANLPLDQFARKLVTALGQNYSDGPSNFWGNYDVISTPVEVAPQVSQLFLGVRLHCAQCHNHPFERWTQSDFYSLAAVFAQVKGKATKQTQEFELFLDPKEVVRHPVTDVPLPAKAPDAAAFSVRDGEDVRVPFADWLTAPENPFFARALVNRLWKQMMGRGLVEPVDDFRITNPATHPELLDALARELVTHRFDQKHVLRLIANSRAYQAASEASPANRNDTKYYSRAYPRRMMAEVYFDAICQVTGMPEEFNNWPEAKRAVQLPENRYSSYFLDAFGRSNRLVICEREEEGTISQALNLIHGREIHDRVCAPKGTLTRLLGAGRDDRAIIDELFLATLSRYPREEERSRVTRQLSGAPSREEGFQDLLWALLSCREFQFNH